VKCIIAIFTYIRKGKKRQKSLTKNKKQKEMSIMRQRKIKKIIMETAEVLNNYNAAQKNAEELFGSEEERVAKYEKSKALIESINSHLDKMEKNITSLDDNLKRLTKTLKEEERMEKLNRYQKELIMRAMEEEAEKDVRIHKGMPQETTHLYHSWIIDGDEIAYSALIKMLDFWSCYFSAGAEVAFQIRDEEHEILMTKLNKQCEENRKRMEKEIDELIAKREEEGNKNAD
jgi:hypothetical protein